MSLLDGWCEQFSYASCAAVPADAALLVWGSATGVVLVCIVSFYALLIKTSL